MDKDSCLDLYHTTAEIGGAMTTAGLAVGSDGFALPIAIAAGVGVEHTVDSIGNYACSYDLGSFDSGSGSGSSSTSDGN